MAHTKLLAALQRIADGEIKPVSEIVPGGSSTTELLNDIYEDYAHLQKIANDAIIEHYKEIGSRIW